jgi:hypothetical protein
MVYVLALGVFVCVFFIAVLYVVEIGRRLGLRHRMKEPEGSTAGFSAIEGAVFGLMGLLIAFTFSGAASRFEARRQLILQETNAIGTAYLRLDVLPESAQPELREDFRRYLDSRIAAFRSLPDMEAMKLEMARATSIQGKIWAKAVAACKESTSPAVMSLVLAAMNEMIDITTARAVALKTHPPIVIFAMLAALVVAGSALAGYALSGRRERSIAHILGYAAILTFVLYVIVDLEFPRYGLIRIDAADEVMVELRKSIN